MKKNVWKEYSYILLLVAALALIVLVLAVSSPFFLSWKNCRNILNQSAIYLVLSVGMTFVICAGQIDLSVGAMIGFSGMIMGILYQKGVGSAGAILLGVLCAVLLGTLNGILVAYGKVNSFIVTLSSMAVLRGVILLVTNSKSVFGFGEVFSFIGSGQIGPVNMPILISLAIAFLGMILLHQTKLGNYCLFLGTNEVAVHRSGIDARKYKVLIFAICGFCAGIAGLIVTSRLNSAEPLAGQGYEMDAIATTILGGTSMQGGKGTIIGTIVACLILNVMKNGMTMLSISSHYQEILTGVVLVVSVFISDRNRRKSEV